MASSQKEKILAIVTEQQASFLLQKILLAAGYESTVLDDPQAVQNHFKKTIPSLVIVGEKLGDSDGLTFASELAKNYPTMPVVLFASQESAPLYKRALQAGLSDCLALPLHTEDLQASLQQALARARHRREWLMEETHRVASGLQTKLDELETLERLGRTVTSTLDIDSVLTAIVEAAVSGLGAEEGSLMLVDEESGELFMRATRNFDDEFARTFRMPIRETLLGSILTTGKPLLLDDHTPQKIKTRFLVHSLIYVPLVSKGRILGVLGVDNRTERLVFTDRDVKLLQAFSEYAVVALENARLYDDVIQERNKLETILTRIQDGVIVLDQDQRILLVNGTARAAYNLVDQELTGRPFGDIFSQSELVGLVKEGAEGASNRTEVNVEDGRVFSVQLTPIPEVGTAITMHDITYLKKLDRIKSEFVSTVSHDLRSPLTAIMGYVELIGRVGPINERQTDFIRRVHLNIQNITSLMDELLNLGHIESGFDNTKEKVFLNQLVQYSLDGFKKQVEMKDLIIDLQLTEEFPPLMANPVQMRTMIDKLLDNAIKYSNSGGTVTVHTEMDGQQAILQVSDTGIGIPAVDLPYIFDKFYRSSNLSGNIPGAGLGLAIVKSVVDNQQGRIWVESVQGHGSKFTVVLPVVEGQ